MTSRSMRTIAIYRIVGKANLNSEDRFGSDSVVLGECTTRPLFPRERTSLDPRHHRIDPAQKMARRNALFEVEQVEQLALIPRLPAHHRKLRRRKPKQTESLFAENHEPFFNTIDPEQTSLLCAAKWEADVQRFHFFGSSLAHTNG
jgi:hypothetical protein